MNQAVFYVRVILTIILIYGVYDETGLYTAIFAALVGAALELIPRELTELRRQVQALKRHGRRLP